MTSISLSELTQQVKQIIQRSFNSPVWIRAEISELRENIGGHCYLELIEKDSDSDAIIAKLKATIWSNTYRMLKPYFESSTGQSLRAGLNVLVSVSVEFHGVYGFSLQIRDIDPIFTIGEMAARRLKIIRQLESDGVVDMNKLLALPARIQRLAIISSPTAAGYDDFIDQLTNNNSQFVFYTRLFPAAMQGEHAEASIIEALEKIYEWMDYFDAVIIIRGGGATTDLACFDSYHLALNCAQFPLPVIVGIGHQRDVSILDLVAHTSLKTPTAVAEFLIDALQEEEYKCERIIEQICFLAVNKIDYEKKHMVYLASKLEHTILNLQATKKNKINNFKQQFQASVRLLLVKKRNKLSLLEKSIETHSPTFLLHHGYTITIQNGKRINSIKQLKEGDKISTLLADGIIESDIKQVNNL